jgi:hypothetical protein
MPTDKKLAEYAKAVANTISYIYPKTSVTNLEVEHVVQMRRRVEQEAFNLKKLQKEVEIREAQVLAKLKRGYPVLSEYEVFSDTKTTPKNVSWKDAWKALCKKLFLNPKTEETRLKNAAGTKESIALIIR